MRPLCGVFHETLASRSYLIHHCSTGEQIVSCTLPSNSVVPASSGLFNPVLCQPMEYLLTKNRQSDCFFLLMLGVEEHCSPSPLQQASWGPNWRIIQIWHWDIIYLSSFSINDENKHRSIVEWYWPYETMIYAIVFLYILNGYTLENLKYCHIDTAKFGCD